MLPQWLKDTLLVGGFIKPGATDEQTQAGTQKMANEVTTLRASVIELEGARDTLANEQKELGLTQERFDELETSLANERKGRAELVVGAAVAAGKIIPADRDARIVSLTEAEDFSAAVTELANEGTKLKTSSSVKQAGTRSNTDIGTSQERRQLVNEKIESGMSYDAGWAAAKKDSPHLFESDSDK